MSNLDSGNEEKTALWALIYADWDAFLGLIAFVAALTLHLFGIVKLDILLAILTILISVMFIRQLRREKPAEKTDRLVGELHRAAKDIRNEMLSVKREVHGIRSSLAGRSNVRIYESRAEAYDAIADILERGMDLPGQKILALGALHGESGSRRTDESSVEQEFKRFNAAMLACMEASSSSWNVRHIYNTTTMARLKVIEDRLSQTSEADGFQVRSFCLPDAIPHIAPLVVADDVLLAIEDPRYFRVEKAIHIKNPVLAKIVMAYFETLWNSRDIFDLRTGDRVRQDEIERLKQKIAENEKSLNS